MIMSDTGKKILETFEKTLPQMSEMEQEKLLSFAEGMAFKTEQQQKENKQQAV